MGRDCCKAMSHAQCGQGAFLWCLMPTWLLAVHWEYLFFHMNDIIYH